MMTFIYECVLCSYFKIILMNDTYFIIGMMLCVYYYICGYVTCLNDRTLIHFNDSFFKYAFFFVISTNNFPRNVGKSFTEYFRLFV